MMDFKAGIKQGMFLIGAASLWIVHQTAPVSALICANDSSRTMFVGGPGTEACSSINDQTTCEKSFHRSGAGPLAPCVWNGSCQGNTRGVDEGVTQSCQLLPDPQTCFDPTRTIALTGGTNGPNSGSEVCQSLSDEESCESAWHTTPKGVGMACCWQDNNTCVGSAWGFSNGSCTHGNTCFAGIATTSGAPVMSPWAFGAVGLTLLAFGTRRLRRKNGTI